jgi:carbon-monoxide dehydrogenase small subunit
MLVKLRVNGVTHSVDIEGNEKLLYTLRKLRYYGAKSGCETGNCGSCVVLVDSIPKNSCLIYTLQALPSSLETIEAISGTELGETIQQALVDTGGIQCGYCTPGIVISTYYLLKNFKDPSEKDIRSALDSHLCRCTGYKKILEGVKLAITRVKDKRKEKNQ